MQQTMRTLGAVLMVELMAACAGGWVTPAFAQRARVPQTGQTQCFDASGNSVLCDGTGQDGELPGGGAMAHPTLSGQPQWHGHR